MKSDPTFLLLARATGIVAYVLLTLSVLAGLLVKSRPFGTAIKPALAVDIHRTLAVLSLTALAGHGLALVLDHTIEIGVLALLVPGTAPYRPFWTGLGVIAGELMLLVYASFGLRKRIGMRNWRRLHWTTYGAFAGATAHGVMAGTDSGAPWALALYFGAVGAVVAATTWRALVPPLPPKRRQPQPATAEAGQPQQRPARSQPGRPHPRPATSEGAS
jgi:methionine sulfoxide reductase heme-binding subunit